MQAKPEFRKSERFGHEYIIKLGDDQALSPYYAVSYNLSETGMHFKSLFELYPGAHILIRIDDYTFGQDPVPAKVVWCKKLETAATFKYGVGVEFLQLEKNFGLKASLPITPRMKTPNMNRAGVVIRMEKR
jgi:Tfp pilus assembly protein PilZ